MARQYGWRYRRKGYVVGRNGDPCRVWTPEEYVRLMGISHAEGAERLARDALLRRGQAWDLQALDELWDRYKLRLPLVEERKAHRA